MPTVKRFEDLEIWRGARKLVVEIYRISEPSRFIRDHALADQIRRAAVSIMANIAEGFDKGSRKEFLRFLEYSLGSASEVKSHLYIAMDLKYIEEDEVRTLLDDATSLVRQIKALIKYLKSHPKRKTKSTDKPK